MAIILQSKLFTKSGVILYCSEPNICFVFSSSKYDLIYIAYATCNTVLY